MTNQVRAFIYAGLTVFIWSTVSTAFKLALSGMTPLQLIYISMLTAAVFHGIVLLLRKEYRQLVNLRGRNWLFAVIPGVLISCWWHIAG